MTDSQGGLSGEAKETRRHQWKRKGPGTWELTCWMTAAVQGTWNVARQRRDYQSLGSEQMMSFEGAENHGVKDSRKRGWERTINFFWVCILALLFACWVTLVRSGAQVSELQIPYLLLQEFNVHDRAWSTAGAVQGCSPASFWKNHQHGGFTLSNL